MATVPPVAHTWSAGDDATSTNLQTLTDVINFLRGGTPTARPTLRALLTSAGTTALANGATAAIPLNAVLEDSDGAYNPASGVYTVKTPGLWLVTGQVAFAGNTTGVRQAFIVAGGTASPIVGLATELAASVDANGRCNATLLTRFAANDTFNLSGFQNSGGVLGLNTAPSLSQPGVALQAVWMSA